MDGIGKYKSPEAKANHIAYNNAYQRNNYDRLNLLLPKGCKAIIQEAAKKRNENLSEYVINALEWYDGLNLSGKK